MANSLVTNQIIAKEFIALSRNTNAFLMSLDRQYDSEFDRTGAKVGQTIRIRLPVSYILRTGPTAIVQNSVENTVNLTIANQAGVDMSFSTVDRTMNIDRFSENFIKPAVNTIVGGIATGVMAASEGGVANWSANYDANGNILSPVAQTWLNAKARIQNFGAPTTDYKIVMHPNTQANVVTSLMGLFNSQPIIAKQYENGDMYHALGFDWMDDQTVILHTTGSLATNSAYTAGSGWSVTTVAGAAQTGNALAVAATTGTLAQGDIIAVAGVQGVNPITMQPNGRMRTFAVTAPVPVGATSIPIYPAILGVDVNGNPQEFQTVNASPANGAQIYCQSGPAAQYRKNLAYLPKAVTMVTADLIMPPNVDGAREVFDEMSVRIVTQYQGMSDQLLTRADVLWGTAWLKPEWATVVPDVP